MQRQWPGRRLRVEADRVREPAPARRPDRRRADVEAARGVEAVQLQLVVPPGIEEINGSGRLVVILDFRPAQPSNRQLVASEASGAGSLVKVRRKYLFRFLRRLRLV